MLTKNEIARLRKVTTNLHKVLDELHQAQGTLYPEGLRTYRNTVGSCIRDVQGLLDKIKLPPTSKRGTVVPPQLDLDEDDEPEAA